MRKKTPVARFTRPSWLWRWHHLLSAFVLFFGVGMMLASVQYGANKFPARAAAADNVRGWLWADPIGWTSLNDLNSGACSPGPCGTYGVNVDPTTRNMNGFAWNDGAGWMCFGDSCNIPACNGGSLPNTPPTGGAPSAYMNPIPAVPTVVEVHGWGKVCNQPTAGWISLNCADPAACAAYAYKVQYDPTTKKFTPNIPPPFNSLAWNGASDGTGFGYIDFSKAILNTSSETMCNDTLDNDLNGLKDCQDPSCAGNAACVQGPGNVDPWGNPNCQNGLNDDGTGIDCASVNCQTDPVCAQNPGTVGVVFNPADPANPTAGLPTCGDGLNNDTTGIDCASPGCAGYVGPPGASCAPPSPPAGSEPSCTSPVAPFLPLGTYSCCHNATDDDSNGPVDCDDLSCQTAEPTCVPAWLQTNFGNVYAQSGVSASSSPFLIGKPNTQYCITTQGTITGFTSGSGCTETGPMSQNITLPTGGTQYQGSLGKLDIAGMKAGRYGAITTLASPIITLPQLLGGKIYYYFGNATLNATNFANGTLQTDHGNGLLLIEGNLTITGDLSYPAATNLTYLRNLASFGVIVVKRTDIPATGNITIQPNVQKLVGAYFAEGTIHDQTACPGLSSCPAEVPLDVYGLMAAHQFTFDRNYRSVDRAAEVISFDGRPVANPPPGMVDLAKSLPISKDAY